MQRVTKFFSSATAALVLILLNCSLVQAQHAPIVFWNVPNWYNGGWFNIRYDSPGQAYSDWDKHVPHCDNGAQAWRLVDVLPSNPQGYPPGSVYLATYNDYNTTDCSLYGGPYNYVSNTRRWAVCGTIINYSPDDYPGGICPVSDIDPDKNKGKPKCPCNAKGDPVNPSTGNKFDFLTVYQGTGVFPLKFTIAYNSQGNAGALAVPELSLGNQRVHTYLTTIRVYSTSGVTSAYVTRADGKVYAFNRSGNAWVGDADVSDKLSATYAGDGSVSGWTYTTESDLREIYNAAGKLTQVVRRDGLAQTLAYNAQGLLGSVTDPQGRSLTLQYDASARMSSLTAPDAGTYSFTYDANANLATVVYPDTKSIHYIYGEYDGTTNFATPTDLTGKLDELGARIDTTKYGDFDHVSSEAGALGSSPITFSYSNPGGIVQYTTQEDLGKIDTVTNEYLFGIPRPLTVTRNCSNCASVVTQYSYDSAGYLASLTNFNGVVTNYTFDDTRGLETQRVEAYGKPEQRTTSTTWNATFRVPSQRSIFNVNSVEEARTVWTYNSRGQALTRTQSDPQNLSNPVRTWTYSYCEQADVNAGTCPLVGLTKSVDGPRTDVSDITTYTYYQTTDTSGCATVGGACHYRGDLQKTTNALGQVTTYVSYDKNGRATRMKDINGVYTDMTYHARGWLLTRTVRANADGSANGSLDATTTFAYDSAGNVTQVTQADGTYLHYVYDAAHRLTDIYDSATPANYLTGDHIHYTLDAAGNRTDEKTYDPSGALKRELSRNYDQLNRLTKLLNNASLAVQTYTNPAEAPPSGVGYVDGYDGNGNAIYSIDGTPSHVGSEQQYDGLNRLVKTLQDHAGTGTTRDTKTQYAYDTRDNLRSVVDPDNLTTSYTYDDLNNLTALSSPDTGNTGYTYDAAGNRKTQTDARGITSTYSYDALNRLTGISYPTASLNITYAYDQSVTGCYNVGRLTMMTDSTGATTYCYDNRGNVLSKSQYMAGQGSSGCGPDGCGGVCPPSGCLALVAHADLSKTLSTTGTTLKVSYIYTLSDRISGIGYPSGALVGYGRDAAGRVNSVRYQPNSVTPAVTVVSNASYYPFGPPSVVSFGNGRTLTKTYDRDYAIDQIVSSSAGSGLTIDASVDVLGNLISASSTVGANPPTQKFAYDPLYRLTNVANGGGTSLLAFTYDLTGDRLSKTPQGQSTQTYAYSGHRLTSVAGAARAYDANGNTTQLNGLSSTYDNRNRLVSAGSTAYDYNGRGERITKVNPATAPSRGVAVGTSGYVYAENGALISDWQQVWQCVAQGGGGGSNPTEKTAGLESKITAPLRCPIVGQTLVASWQGLGDYVYLDSTPIAYVAGGTLYYIETDQLGTPRQLIKPGATTAADTTVWKWDYFANNSAFGENTPSVQTVTFNLRFPGQYYDAETGLNYNLFRDYESSTGRYLESDPIGLGGGMNTYAYVDQAPLVLADRSGLTPQDCFWQSIPGIEEFDMGKQYYLKSTKYRPMPLCLPARPHMGIPSPKDPHLWTPWDFINFEIRCWRIKIDTLEAFSIHDVWQKGIIKCYKYDSCGKLIDIEETPSNRFRRTEYWQEQDEEQWTYIPIATIRTY